MNAQMKNPDHILSLLINQFKKSYFTKKCDQLIQKIQCNSKEYSDLKINVSQDRLGDKVSRQIDLFVDNVRIFICFLADFCIFFYNLDQIIFQCTTNESHTIGMKGNPFLEREALGNYFVDLFFNKDVSEKITQLLTFQSKNTSEQLLTNILMVKNKISSQELGIPNEMLERSKHKAESFLTEEGGQDKFIDQQEYKTIFGTDNKRAEEVRDLETSKFDDWPAQENLNESTNMKNTELSFRIDPEDHLKTKADFNKSLINASFSLFKDQTIVCDDKGEVTMNQTNGNILEMLGLMEEARDPFEQSVKMAQTLPQAYNPSRKLIVLTKTLATALSEMRRSYSRLNPGKETKFQVTIETLLSILVHVVIRADIPDLVAEFKLLKVYFISSKHYNNLKLVYLLKSSIKSINKMGMLLTQRMSSEK
jgi:hypothetical protein